MCIHAHPDIPLASRKMTDILCRICVTSVSLGNSMDLNITHSYVVLIEDPSAIDLDSDWKAPMEEWGNWTGDEEHQTGDKKEKVRQWC